MDETANAAAVFQHLVIDPPWKKRKGGRRAVRPMQGRSLDYPTMETDEIFSLLDENIFPFAAGDACVWLWTVDEFLRQGEDEMERRGWRRHARVVWDKGNGVAPAFTVRYTHEYMLWFYRPGRLPPVSREERGKLSTVIRAPGREHSRKPDEAYRYIDRLYPTGRRLDVFSREPREGWEQWGNQCEKFVIEARAG